MDLENNQQNNDIKTKSHHAGNAPENIREVPHGKHFDNTTLPEAVDQGLIETEHDTLPESWIKSQPETKENGFTRRKKIIAGVIAATTLALGGVIGVKMSSDNERGVAPVGPVATATATPGSPERTASPESTMSESESNFAKYFDTLTPKQQEVRESLDPDKLAAMDSDQLFKAFVVPSSEVMGSDGKIDPKLYAEAFTARLNGMDMAGCSKVEYDKWGGLNTFGLNVWDKVVDTYRTPASTAFLGYKISNGESAKTTLANCSVVDDLLANDLGDYKKPSERYHTREVPNLDSIKAVVSPNGTVESLSFDVRLTDNWETETIAKISGVSKQPTDLIAPWTISDLHINKDGEVLPTQVQNSISSSN